MNCLTRFRTLFFVSTAAFAALSASAYNWDKISDEEMASTECEFDPGAAAEVLYKEIIYDLLEVNNRRIIKTHLRTKIYDQSALDYARRTRFWYNNYFQATAINARVVKPDGSYVEIESDDIVTQVESKKDRRTTKSTTISIPNVEVGDIVEYRYRIVLDEGYYLPKDEVMFQEEWPIRKLYLKMKPYVYRGSGFKWTSHNCTQRLEKGNGGFYEINLENQPGYPDEPYQAPDSDAKSWFAFYNVTSLKDGDDFWLGEGRRLYKGMLSDTKTDKVVEAKAKELAAGKSTQDEKLHAFYDFCVGELVNAYHGEADRLTQSQRDELNDKWSASKTLSKGFGTGYNINTVFCALARAVGIDARLASCADRSDYAFTRAMEQVDVALPDSVVAVKNGDDWIFYNPASKYAPFGQLDWIHDNVVALVPDKKELNLVRTGAALPEHNKTYAEGDFQLSENGELSGTISMTATGNQGLVFNQMLDSSSESEREEIVKAAMKEAWPNAKIDNVVSKNVSSPFDPLQISCDLVIPNYAEAVGSRIFFQPNVESRYSEAEFPSPTRKTPVYFDFKYLEESRMEIGLPEGYELEAPSAPVPFEIAGFINYAPKLSFNKSKNSVVYNRSLSFSGNRYASEAYPAIKNAFDQLLVQDHHALTLKAIEAEVSDESAEEAEGDS